MTKIYYAKRLDTRRFVMVCRACDFRSDEYELPEDHAPLTRTAINLDEACRQLAEHITEQHGTSGEYEIVPVEDRL